MKKYEHMVNLVLGDWSSDGHRLTDTVTISSNLDKKTIEKAYKVGVRKLKIDLVADVASEHEDNIITNETWEKLVNVGLSLDDLYMTKSERDSARANLKDDKGFSIWTDSFAKIYLFIVSCGNVEFQYHIEENDSPNINIGGYGLFT